MSALRLRCLRCGAWDDMDPLDPYAFGICSSPCFSKQLATLGDDSVAGLGRMIRFQERYLKGAKQHPTYKDLTAWLLGESAPCVERDNAARQASLF